MSDYESRDNSFERSIIEIVDKISDMDISSSSKKILYGLVDETKERYLVIRKAQRERICATEKYLEAMVKLRENIETIRAQSEGMLEKLFEARKKLGRDN